MKFHEILIIFSAVFVLISAENKNPKQEQDNLHEKSHHGKILHEKSQYHISSRNKLSKSENQRSNNFRHLIYRDSNEKCSWVCNGENETSTTTPSNSSGLQVDYNGNASLIGITKKASNTSLVLDGQSNVAAIINEPSGVVIVIDFNSKLIYRITNNTYFKNLSSLQALLDIGKQSSEKYNFSSNNSLVLGDLNSLGCGHSCSLEDLNQIESFTSQIKVRLAFLYHDKGSFHVSKNLRWFLTVNLAFANLEGCQSLNIPLNLSPVFGASSGVEALLKLLFQIGKHEDLSKLLSKYLSSPEKLLCLLLDVSKGSDDGIDGLITILFKIIDVIRGKGSVNDIINSLMNYNPSSEGDGYDLSQIINEALDLIRSENTSFQNFPAFEGIFNTLTALNNNNLVWNHLNVSDIIKMLRVQNPREVTQIITKNITQFLLSQGIPQLMDYLKNIPGYGNILPIVFKGNLSEILSNPNVTSFLSNYLDFGNIIRNASSSIGNGFDIGHYLNSISILGYLKNVFGGNSTTGPIGNIIGNFENEISNIQHSIQHGIGGFLGSITGDLLGSGSAHGGTSKSSSGNPLTSGSIPKNTETFEFNGLFDGSGQISNRKKISHRKHNLHEKKENKLHHDFQERKPEHEHHHH